MRHHRASYYYCLQRAPYRLLLRCCVAVVVLVAASDLERASSALSKCSSLVLVWFSAKLMSWSMLVSF